MVYGDLMATHTHHEPLAWTLGDRIRKARRHAKLTNKQLADPLGVTAPSISNWENGVSKPHPLFVREVARICEVDPEWLLGTRDQGEAMSTWMGNVAGHPHSPEVAGLVAA